MSKSLPESEEEMLRIPHVTKANYDKYGHSLLDVTQRFAAQKLGAFAYFLGTDLVGMFSTWLSESWDLYMYFVVNTVLFFKIN